MRVFFLINKFLSARSSGNNLNDISRLNLGLRQKALVKLRRKNFKKISFIFVYSGSSKGIVNFSNKKLLSSSNKIRNISKLKFNNFINKFGQKNPDFPISSFYSNILYKDKIYNFLNKNSSLNFYYKKYFKDVFHFQLNDIYNFMYSAHNSYNMLAKNDMYFLNQYSYILQKNELNFLCNNNLYENDSSDVFFKKINFFNLKNIVLNFNTTATFKEGSYLKQLETNSSFFSSLFNRRLFFEKREFFNFFKDKYAYNIVFYKNNSFNFFNFKNKLIFFNYNSDFIYKYLKGRGKKFYISYYNKLNHFFFNLKKNDLLYRKVSKKIFLKKYNMLKLYINDLIGGSLNKNLLMGFIFKSPRFFKKENLNLFLENFNALYFFNHLYFNKKQFLNFVDSGDFSFYNNFKNYLSFSFYKQINSVNSFFTFFILSLNSIRHLPLLNNLVRDIYFLYNYQKLFYIKQMLEFCNFNIYKFLFKSLTNFSGVTNTVSSSLYKNYFPFFYDFIFKTNESGMLNLHNIASSFKNFLFSKKFFIKYNNNFLNKNYLSTAEDIFFTNYKYFYNYLNFYNNLKPLNLMSKKNNFEIINIYWLNLLYYK